MDANITLCQLGGYQFLSMTGAMNFVSGVDSLTFDIPSAVKNNANRVRVRLNSDDTYTLTCFKVNHRKLTCAEIESRFNIYCDELRGAFEDMTGLYTYL